MKLVVSVAFLVLALGGAGALAVWGQARAPAGTGEFHIEATGPEGPLLNTTVRVEEATVLRALQVAAGEAGIALVLEEYPGMGTYVRAIAGFEGRGAQGWVYEVLHEGAWTNGDRSAEFHSLQNGDAVRWHWAA